ALTQEIISCRQCERLVAWREAVATKPPRRFRGQGYWARPVPGFGDPCARLLVIGLAPAAHGGNRTGRIFTGDRSGEWLFRALYRAGFANQPASVSRDDGLILRDCYVSAVARCAPPQNKLTPGEIANCSPFLEREVSILWPRLRCVVVLGRVAFAWWLQHLRRRGFHLRINDYTFAHSAEFHMARAPRVLCSFHPSQQNTSTKRLTEPMFDAVWQRAREILDASK
ncbi:MAG: uracil-DNA glycosylase, partial [Candidatus Sumerlaeaceae bacterium]